MVIAAALALSGCGGGAHDGPKVDSLGGGKQRTNSTNPSAAAKDPRESMLQAARCLRKQGLDVPDPDGGGGLQIGGPGISKEKIDAAVKACQRYMGGGSTTQAQKDSNLKIARCMRKHGLDWPDEGTPTIGAGDEQKAQGALKACLKEMSPKASVTSP
ncbi:hypothetical protein AB0C96_01260 [Streptomyces sp. NPDC048506]|uniref:hypothetical protein n=1 Tax=Streptomyces sp. NPDC048506 TaxID=3155028 RepID=UPI003416F588